MTAEDPVHTLAAFDVLYKLFCMSKCSLVKGYTGSPSGPSALKKWFMACSHPSRTDCIGNHKPVSAVVRHCDKHQNSMSVD